MFSDSQSHALIHFAIKVVSVSSIVDKGTAKVGPKPIDYVIHRLW